MAIDLRFYQSLEGMTFGDIARELGIDPRNDPNREITGISSFEMAGPQDLCFVEDPKLLDGDGVAWAQGACLIRPSLASGVEHLPQFLSTDAPRQTFFDISSRLFASKLETSSQRTAAIHATAQISENCQFGNGAAIGPRTRIGANTVIGPGVQIGADCEIGSNASIFFALLGNDVRILSGARIGETGFGLMSGQKGLQDTPHFGRVIVQDGVTIGANSCVDRGLLGDTLIGEKTKIDNLCHIGHNTQIGRQVVMAAFAGISGSCQIGDNVQMGGRVGLIDHITVGKDAQIAAGSAVLNNVPEGAVWAGHPAKPIKTWQREILWLKRQAKRRQDT